jgi:ubiquinone/menaquinone biosynthesis C-methylase UbiE
VRPHFPELLDLDGAPLAEVARALADLRRYNRWLGGRAVLLRLLSSEGLDRFSLLDVGSASGDLAEAVLSRFPRARVALCDRKPAHLPGRGERTAAVAHALPFPRGSFDYVAASLLLHQFRDHQVVEALREFGRVARRAVLVNDLERHWLPLCFVRMSAPVFARSPITRHDAPASVRQAFHLEDLARLAREAGLRRVVVRRHRPWFRLSLVARHE